MTQIPEHLLQRARARREAMMDDFQSRGGNPSRDGSRCTHGYTDYGRGGCHPCLVDRVDQLETLVDELVTALELKQIKDKYT